MTRMLQRLRISSECYVGDEVKDMEIVLHCQDPASLQLIVDAATSKLALHRPFRAESSAGAATA